MSAAPRPHKTPRRIAGAALGLTLAVAAAPFFSPASAAQPTSDLATPAAETAVIGGANATDPALWVHPTDPTKSMIIGANNVRLSTYDLAGALLVQGAAGAANDFTSVDTRNGVTLGSAPVSVAAAVGNHKVRFFTIDAETRALTDVSATAGGITEPDLPKHGGSASNICMYKSPVSGTTYAFVMADNGYAQQLELVPTQAGDKFGIKVVRGYTGAQSGAWDTAATAVDGCVVDDETRTLYVSERGAGIWKFDAEPPATPSTPTPGELIDRMAPDGNLQNTTKGLAIVRTGEGAGYLLASSFDGTLTGAVDSTFNVYDRISHAFIRTFKVPEGSTVDNCRESKGIDATASNLGAGFESGMFICQDSRNRPATGGGTVEDNYKMVPMELIADMAAPVPTTVTTAPQVITTTPTTAPISVPVPNKSGYWTVGSEGKVYAFGEAKTFGDASLPAGAQAVDIEPTPSGNGYWIIDDLGNVYARGDAMPQPVLNRSKLTTGEVVTSLSSTKEGKGYWIFTSLGRVIPFGDAVWYGDVSGTKLNGPVLDSIPTASGKGYYMVASDGGIFSFGDAAFKGSMGNVKLNKPVQSLVPDRDGDGYWLVASDGGIFAFDAAFKGSLGSVKLNKPITGMVRYGDGYMMVGEDGGIFNFSDKPFSGSLGASPPNKPITSVAVLDVAAAK